MVRSRHYQIIGIETEDERAMFPLAFALHLDRAERRVLDRDRQLLARGDEDMAAVGLAAQDRREESDHRAAADPSAFRSEEHTSELQSLMRISSAVFCLKK